ncbi:MAG: PDZ domain-containing protein [Dehalococcoidia bacterium]|nr:PDZ domain-containing protein [Dehalococcoidia bacterium]
MPVMGNSTTAAADLGITYQPVTERTAAYYEFGIQSGALVTEVVPGGLADYAGMKTGDIITKYNDSPVTQEKTLLAIMRDCPRGNKIKMQIFRGGTPMTIETVHWK